jgi:DNA-binding transcriptional regulator YdaS (Cro superfamily)
VVPHTRGIPASTVIDIRRAIAKGEQVRSVAARLGVSEGAVRQTASGHIHRSVGGPRTRSHLNAAEARDIRDRHSRGESRARLAKSFKVSRATINDILAGRTHVAADGPLTEVMPRGQWRRSP